MSDHALTQQQKANTLLMTTMRTGTIQDWSMNQGEITYILLLNYTLAVILAGDILKTMC